MTIMYRTIPVSREEILEGNMDAVEVAVRAAMEEIRESGRVHLWTFALAGYQDEPKKPFELPEFKRWCRAVHEFASAFLACALDTPSLTLYLCSLFKDVDISRDEAGRTIMHFKSKEEIEQYILAVANKVTSYCFKIGKTKIDAYDIWYPAVKRICEATSFEFFPPGRPEEDLLPVDIRRRLFRNGLKAKKAGDDPPDFRPVVKLFTPDAGAVWLLTHVDPADPTIAFGLCDLGVGCPEWGTVSLKEVATMRGPKGRAVECDDSFRPKKTINAYTREAAKLGRINA